MRKLFIIFLIIITTAAFAKAVPEVVIDASLLKDPPQNGLRPERLRRSGKVFAVYLFNDSRQPGEALVKIKNLSMGGNSFDYYVDRQLVGTFSVEDIEKGQRVPLRPGITNLDDLDYLSRIASGTTEVISSLRSYTEGDGKVVRDLSNQINGWAKLALRIEEKSRATDIMINPSNEPLPRLTKDDRASPEDAAKICARYIERIAVVRSLINGRVKDPVFRELSASTLLPHEMEVKLTCVTEPDGKPSKKAIVTFTNRAEVPVSVRLGINPADGVTAKATGKPDIGALERGKSITCGFILSGSVKPAAIEKRNTAVARVDYKGIAFSTRRTIAE